MVTLDPMDSAPPHDAAEEAARGNVVSLRPVRDVLAPPPHNFEVEMALLGCVGILGAKGYERIAGITKPEHFHDPVHAQIYEAMAALIEGGRHPDPFNMPAAIFTNVGGPAYFARLCGSVLTTANTKDYAITLRDIWVRRQVFQLANEAARMAEDGEDGAALAVRLAQEMDALRTPEGRAVVTLSTAASQALTAAEDAYRRDGAIAGITTGYADLDCKLGGLERGNLYVWAARPSMGKTGLAVWTGHAVAKAGHHVHFVSCEMSAAQIARRLACGLTGLGLSDVRNGTLDKRAFGQLIQAQQSLAALPFSIDESTELAEIKARARAQARRGKLGLLILDHMQLVRVGDDVKRHGRTAVVTEVSAELKQLAKELDVPLIALAQLSRANEARDDKRPQLSDLRDSGTIEQDADCVMFLYRESYYLEWQRPIQGMATAQEQADRLQAWQEAVDRARGKAELIVAKQRDGATGSVGLRFEEKTARFRDNPQEELL